MPQTSIGIGEKFAGRSGVWPLFRPSEEEVRGWEAVVAAQERARKTRRVAMSSRSRLNQKTNSPTTLLTTP